MRHRIVTCKNHPDLRWFCKEIAWTEGRGYNHKRNLFFNGTPSGKGMYSDGSGLDCVKVKGNVLVEECSCPVSALMLAPEDVLVKKGGG